MAIDGHKFTTASRETVGSFKNSDDSRLLPQVWKSLLRYAKFRRDLSTGTYRPTRISEQLLLTKLQVSHLT
jgi:hypothetical protein